ncbi:hypothetical protein MMC20_005124 [Loxospora ochrophaea]|nr:hypothetical protein [Loxospora ochrophaea]
MSPKLLEVQHDSEFAELIEVYRAGFTDPGTKLWPLFSGDYRPDPELQHAALEETTQRLRSYHRSDPTSHWLKVVDDSTGQVIGGGRWCFYETGNPYDGHGTREATWWPEGRPREVASFFMNQFWATRARHMDRPHAFLNILFTHPEHRRKGVGALVIKWGLERADRLGLESFVEATKEGKTSYESFGFEVIDINEFHGQNEKLDKDWTELESNFLPFTWWSMTRSIGK